MLGGFPSVLAWPHPRRPNRSDRLFDHNRMRAILPQERAFAQEQSPPHFSYAMRRERQQPWLPAALAELRECVREAGEEGYPEPTKEALALAEAVLKRIARLPLALPEPSVYPTADHEIDLFFRKSGVGAGVLVIVDAEGGGACFSNIGDQRRARYDDANALPDPFVENELNRLSRLPHAA